MKQDNLKIQLGDKLIHRKEVNSFKHLMKGIEMQMTARAASKVLTW